jgi:hypothetical protein
MFEVEADYEPGCKPSFDDPGSDGELEIESISIGDQDITDFLTNQQYQKIKDAAIVVFAEDYKELDD